MLQSRRFFMSPRNNTTITVIDNEVIIAKRERSSIWQCRYRVEKKWQRTSTGERDVELAKEKAKELFYRARARKDAEYTPITRKFKDVANLVLKQLRDDFKAGKNIQKYKDYTNVIERFFLPVLSRYNIDSITGEELDLVKAKRVEILGKEPSKSTLMTHNAALNRIFDEAIYRGYMIADRRPVLKASGKKSERREEFTVDEVKKIRSHYTKFIDEGMAHSKALRSLLCDYIEVLLDTGARPGKELLDMEWWQVDTKFYPVAKKTGKVKETGVDGNDNEEEVIVNPNHTAFLQIKTGKTGARIATGRTETIQALRRIAERNYGESLDDVISNHSKDKIFTYREYQSKRRGNLGKEAELTKPTSFSKMFDEFLTQLNLLKTKDGKKRQFYSLRHTYATLMLIHDAVSIHTLAKQMGTSVGMIEKHYSHLDVVKAAHQLQGAESRQILNSANVWRLPE